MTPRLDESQQVGSLETLLACRGLKQMQLQTSGSWPSALTLRLARQGLLSPRAKAIVQQ